MSTFPNVNSNQNYFDMKRSYKALLFILGIMFSFIGCSGDGVDGYYDYELNTERGPQSGVFKLEKTDNGYVGVLNSFGGEKIDLENIEISGDDLSATYERWRDDYLLKGSFSGGDFNGKVTSEENEFQFTAQKHSGDPIVIDRSKVQYILPENSLKAYERKIDHEGIIVDLGRESYRTGERIYNSNCINCHGTPEIEGSLPTSTKFWKQPFKSGGDPYTMYQTITRGVGAMVPILTLTPQEKYSVVNYIRQEFVRQSNESEYYKVTTAYLAGLPEGSSSGPAPQPYTPWSDQDYGNFFINTYELVDAETGPERFHSPGPLPYVDEDYTENNFAYKGIAVRLDKGEGGVSDGNTWMMFDHDVMRVAGGWTGEGFIDWNAILLDDKHETYPRTIGKLHFETPVGPGWANPANGSFYDTRFTARDGRKFGPLPKKWADYKGLYYHGDKIIISYSVGRSSILELLGMEKSGEQTVFTRTLNISSSNSKLKLRVAPLTNKVKISGEGASLFPEKGYFIMVVEQSQSVKVKLFIADAAVTDLESIVSSSAAPESLTKFTKGGPAHYPEELTAPIVRGSDNEQFAVDQLSPPYDNPWKARMRLSGIDFMKDGNIGVGCTTDGDVFSITGLTDGSSSLKWKRIGSGLFQPLGIKVVDEKIYVICRDQLVRLHDYNGDDETDFYEAFNHDHQVSDHFHEFAMGLQTDRKGNFYYAKSGRHAREGLIPQHGTLLKVSKDGSKTDIIATGFRAANGICLNPDGSFIVTDQQGFWNPMNRINWVEYSGKAKFYGNMWGYEPPKDTSRAAMEQPMVWIDMEFDRSPAELIWVDSKKWGPLNGSLLNTSYGFGKVQLVYNEKVSGQRQGGVIDMPGMKFYTGVMRGRFHPKDGNLYLCGMSAWSTSANTRSGDLYRVRYTGKPLTMPVKVNAEKSGMKLSFAGKLDSESAMNVSNFEVKTWDILRSANYGSERYNVKTLDIAEVKVLSNGKAVKLMLDKIAPVDVMTIKYNIYDETGNTLQGTVQNTIHALGNDSR